MVPCGRSAAARRAVSATSAVRVPMPPMNGSGSRNPNSARLGMVCARLASADERPRDRAAAARRGCRAGCRSPRRSRVDTSTSTTCSPSRAANSARCDGDEREQRAHPNRVSTSSATRADRRSMRAAHCRRVARDDLPVVEHRHAIGERERLGHVVRDQDDRRDAASPAAAELAMQLGSRDRIERAERLVHQQHRRIGRERARQADALPLPARQLVGPAAAELRRLAGRPARAARRRARRSRSAGHIQQPRHERDVRGDRHVREQPDVLDHVAGLAAQRDRVPRRDAAAVHPHLAGVGAQQPVDQPQQRGLAAAAAADQRHHLAFGDRERDVAQHRARPPRLADDVEEVDQA